jgi:hypothetical protein
MHALNKIGKFKICWEKIHAIDNNEENSKQNPTSNYNSGEIPNKIQPQISKTLSID